MHYKDFAKLLAHHLTNESLKSNNKLSLRISLVMCESLKFGKMLHKELKEKYGIYCDIPITNENAKLAA